MPQGRSADDRGGDAGGKQGLPKSIHTSTACGSTIPSADLTGITTKNKLPTYSGLSKHVIPAAWALAVEITKQQQVQLAALCWQSMLAQVGDVLEHVQECFTLVCVTCSISMVVVCLLLFSSSCSCGSYTCLCWLWFGGGVLYVFF